MSLLDIAQGASDIIGLPTVSQVIGNNTNDVRQLRQVIQQSGNALCQMTNSNGGGWSVLNRIHEFDGQDGVTEYNLPSDFKKLIVETAWQKDKYWLMRGSLNAKQWERIRNRQATVSYNVFRIFRTSGSGGAQARNAAPNTLRKFTIEPAPGETTPLVYEYISNAWWVSQDGSTFRNRPEEDTDESLFGDDIHILDAVWRFKAANAFNFAADIALFEDFRDTAIVQDEAAEPIPIGYGGRVGGNRDESDVGWCP